MKLISKIKAFFKKLFSKSSKKSDSSSVPSVKKMKISWCYGGFDGSRANEDSNVKISNFKMDNRAMSIHWDKGMSAWGYGNTDPKGIACVFFYDDKSDTWFGGKFEFISTSRSTREWKNIKDKYKGWDYNKFISAKKHCFCVVAGDGKKRTNFAFD